MVPHTLVVMAYSCQVSPTPLSGSLLGLISPSNINAVPAGTAFIWVSPKGLSDKVTHA